MTYNRIQKNRPLMDESELIDSFAHEIHHLGLGKIIRHKIQTLSLNELQNRVLSFLTTLVEEGSATYLIDGHRDLNLIRTDPGFSGYFNKTNKLLSTCEKIIRSALEGEIKNENDFDKATSPMIGNSYHFTGAAMLSVVDRVQGFDSIMEILADPRLLLIKYNEAAVSLLRDSVDVYTYNNELAENVSVLGNKKE